MTEQSLLERHARFRRLSDYLAAKAPARRLAGRQHVEPAEIPDLLPYLALHDVVAGPGGDLRFRIRLLGTEVVKHHGSDVTGKFLDEVLSGPRAQEIIAECRAVVTTREPQYRRSSVAAPEREHIGYERLTFPLASDGVNVDMLISVFVFMRKQDQPKQGREM
jgi:hypothetical protein